MVNIGYMMANRAYISPDLEGFVGDNYRYTYKQVNERVNQLAHYLKDNNINYGDRIAILCKNNQHFVTALFAASKIGAITVPLNWRLHASELDYIINDCQASFLLYDSNFSDTVNQLRPSIPVKNYLQVGKTENDSDVEFEEALAKMPANEPNITGGGDDPSIIMYTSGTTGKPKGAILSHNNAFWATIGIAHTIDWRFKDRFLSAAPLFHIGGLAPIITNIHKGSTTVFMPDFDPVQVWNTIEKEKINNLMSVPLMLAAMQNVPGIEQKDLSSLRHIVCGGSSVPEQIIDTYKNMGIKILKVYGITEYSGAVTFWTHDMPFETRYSVGKPVFHGQIKIIDPETDKELSRGQIGEIACGGPQVFNGYWEKPEATSKSLKNNWFYSGDLGKKDEEGFIYVIDRLKDMIISGGENIYSAEVESAILNHPSVAEVAVVGVPDEKWGEIPRAYVVKKPGTEATEEEIINTCLNNLAKYKCVKEVNFIDALPKNAVGKILKTKLKENN